MESLPRLERVTFEVLQLRLLAVVKLRINNGEYTERGLARILGISQPQIHNVLKGLRRLQPELADRILCKFAITVLDLITIDELIEAEHFRRDENWGAAVEQPREQKPSVVYRKPAALVVRRPWFEDEKAR
jgi:hypothetical protein